MTSGAPSPVQPVGPFLAAAPKDVVTTSLGSALVGTLYVLDEP